MSRVSAYLQFCLRFAPSPTPTLHLTPLPRVYSRALLAVLNSRPSMLNTHIHRMYACKCKSRLVSTRIGRREGLRDAEACESATADRQTNHTTAVTQPWCVVRATTQAPDKCHANAKPPTAASPHVQHDFAMDLLPFPVTLPDFTPRYPACGPPETGARVRTKSLSAQDEAANPPPPGRLRRDVVLRDANSCALVGILPRFRVGRRVARACISYRAVSIPCPPHR